jgi:F0F1-type ATP synthase assembly protein I
VSKATLRNRVRDFFHKFRLDSSRTEIDFSRRLRGGALIKMDSAEPPSRQQKKSGIGMIGLAFAIPGIMLAAPIIGCLIGVWLDKKFGTGSKLTLVFLVLGLAAGGRETYRLIQRISSEQDEQKK